MKKVTAMLLTLAVSLSLCACTNSGPASTGSDSESAASSGSQAVSPEKLTDIADKASAYIESVIDTSGMAAETGESEDMYIYRYWNMGEETADAALTDEIEIDGNTIVLGKTTKADLDKMDFKMEGFPEVLEPGLHTSIILAKDGKNANLALANDSETESQPVDNIPVNGFTCGSAEFAIPFNYAGVTNSSSIEDVVKLLGAPNSDLHFSTDGEFTEILLSYSMITDKDGAAAQITLGITYLYHPESNTASLYTVLIDKSLYE